MKTQLLILGILLLASGCSSSSVVSTDLDPIDGAIDKDAILHLLDSKSDSDKTQTSKEADKRAEKPDELLSTLKPDDDKEQSTKTVPLGNKDDAIEHHLLLQD